jgi:hypothetical protein
MMTDGPPVETEAADLAAEGDEDVEHVAGSGMSPVSPRAMPHVIHVPLQAMAHVAHVPWSRR